MILRWFTNALTSISDLTTLIGVLILFGGCASGTPVLLLTRRQTGSDWYYITVMVIGFRCVWLCVIAAAIMVVCGRTLALARKQPAVL